MTVMKKLCMWTVFLVLAACSGSKVQEHEQKASLEANREGKGPEVVLTFVRGEAHNHPSFALWAEDADGNYLQTLFVTRAVGTGTYEHGDPSSGKWKPGEIRRPAALPYWSHKRGIREEDGLFTPAPRHPVPDAFTGATPSGDFTLMARFDDQPPRRFMILFEINQTWDWNEYWTNNRYPDDDEYKTSCQPALVYRAEVDLDSAAGEYPLRVIGHSHYAGRDGKLYTDLSTMTTALHIADSLRVRLVTE